MNKTYEEILDSMKSAYFEECKSIVEDNSETLKRFEILASELFSLSCHNDHILKQAFIQTASGEYLDKLGEIRGCYRKTPTPSEGMLCFSINQPSEEDINIPEGTVCSVIDKPFLQFATTKAAVIARGETQVSVKAKSLSSGSEYNAKANTVTVMVNAPVGVSAVTNEYDFTGGYSTESDDVYRQRILRCFSFDQNGINASSYENRVMRLDYVVDCKIIPNDFGNGMIIYVATKSNTISMDEQYQIYTQIPVLAATGMSYSVKLSEKDKFDLMVNIGVEQGYDKQNIVDRIKEIVSNRFTGIRIGYLVFMNELRSLIYNIDGIDMCEFYSKKIYDDAICPDEGKILSLENLEVNIIYG